MERISGDIWKFDGFIVAKISKSKAHSFFLNKKYKAHLDIRDSPSLSNIKVALFSWVGLETHNNHKPNHVIKVGNL